MFPQHLIDINDLSTQQIQSLIHLAQKFQDYPNQIPSYAPQSAGMLFFEDSTRTLHSFQLATQRLGMHSVVANTHTLSLNKGESILDMLHTWHALGIEIAVIRHSDNDFCQALSQAFHGQMSIINAGNGTQSHPTQALLDAMTIYQRNENFSSLKVVIMGDFLHSRVAHSQVKILRKLSVKNIHWVGPKEWAPPTSLGIQSHHSADEALDCADVVVCLRVQHERMQSPLPTNHNYLSTWGLTPDRLNLCNKHAQVLHPGPINRDVEIASSVADGAQSCIKQQVSNGLSMRMAIMATLSTHRLSL